MNKMDSKITDTIIKSQCKKELSSLSKYACQSSEAIREGAEREDVSDNRDIRAAFFRDTDRLLHSMSYSKYIDKTQVFYLFENDLITHRVLHVQLVSKIARTIGRCLSLNEDLIEAIALGHDIGHAPFGHDGERYLNEICKKENIGCFVHNAQSVRFLHQLENNGRGLNLTLQTLDGILCHNGEILKQKYEPNKGKTFDDFQNELRNCFSEEGYDKTLIPMTLEGCVVRISDVIAYIGRDIEDAVTLGLIDFTDLPKEATKVLGDRNRDMVDTLVTDLINNSFDKGYLEFSDEVFCALQNLKTFNYENIYHNKYKSSQDHKIENIFSQMFEVYLNELKENKDGYFLAWAKKKNGPRYFKETASERMVIDYMAGMTDDYLLKEYNRYFIPESFGYKIKKL